MPFVVATHLLPKRAEEAGSNGGVRPGHCREARHGSGRISRARDANDDAWSVLFGTVLSHRD
jgi:hypothetical protein